MTDRDRGPPGPRVMQVAMAGWTLLLVACGSPEPASLVLDGPDRVRVERLGGVDGPAVRLDDGGAPDGLSLTLSRDGVARIEDGRVVAEGPGEVVVRAEWEGQRVEWTLRVELETTVAFVRPPDTLSVGEQARLGVAVSTGDRPVAAPAVEWSSSDPGVLRVDAQGAAEAVAPGQAWVTARSGGGQAMAEIRVVDPDR